MPLTAPAPAPANWFGDPFVQVSAAVANCPEPLGPRITPAERLAQSHHRAERGTTCFLQGQCSEPNAYRYDADIARAVVQALRQSPRVAQGTLWVTVQGRDVFIEGCAPAAQATATEAEGLARQVPQVLAAVAAVFDGRGPAPYRTWPNAPAGGAVQAGSGSASAEPQATGSGAGRPK
ncbi:BON domain-containing protein [Ideonella dechloratans]|uniref:BON domain-containing protein n=1 Tax=Ideonella dechloratans TaxID=36863 RepID=UPI0035AE4936